MSPTADIITSSPVEATASHAYAGALSRLYDAAAASFPPPTATAVDRGHTAPGTGRTPVATVADPEVMADLADAPELRAIEELRAWLHLSYEDVARVAGLRGASLLHHWRQRYRTGTPVRPRASTVEQLWRVHALVRALAEALEGAAHGYAVRLWIRRPEAGATPLELLFAGRVQEVEGRARRLLFDSGAHAAPAWRVVALESDDELMSVDTTTAHQYQDSDFA